MGSELFSDGRLADILEQQFEDVAAVVDELTPKSLRHPKKAVKKAIAEVAVEAPEIRRDKVVIAVDEGDPVTARLRVPFEGDPSMFALRPTDYSLTPPEATVSDADGALDFSRDFALGTPSDAVTAWAASELDSVEQYLYWQAADIGLHTKRLRHRVVDLVTARQDRLGAVGDLQSELDDVDEV